MSYFDNKEISQRMLQTHASDIPAFLDTRPIVKDHVRRAIQYLGNSPKNVVNIAIPVYVWDAIDRQKRKRNTVKNQESAVREILENGRSFRKLAGVLGFWLPKQIRERHRKRALDAMLEFTVKGKQIPESRLKISRSKRRDNDNRPSGQSEGPPLKATKALKRYKTLARAVKKKKGTIPESQKERIRKRMNSALRYAKYWNAGTREKAYAFRYRYL